MQHLSLIWFDLMRGAGGKDLSSDIAGFFV